MLKIDVSQRIDCKTLLHDWVDIFFDNEILDFFYIDFLLRDVNMALNDYKIILMENFYFFNNKDTNNN